VEKGRPAPTGSRWRRRGSSRDLVPALLAINARCSCRAFKANSNSSGSIWSGQPPVAAGVLGAPFWLRARFCSGTANWHFR
jgi:hypothetical protein